MIKILLTAGSLKVGSEVINKIAKEILVIHKFKRNLIIFFIEVFKAANIW